MPHNIPIGTAIMAAIKTISKLPKSAFAIPPPGSPTGCGIFLKKFQLIFERPVFKT